MPSMCPFLWRYLPDRAAGSSCQAHLWDGIMAILRRTWYRRLASINRLIAEARQRVKRHQAFISNLKFEEPSTCRAFARLRECRVILQSLLEQREAILVKVRRFPLPAHQMRQAWREVVLRRSLAECAKSKAPSILLKIRTSVEDGISSSPVQRFPAPKFHPSAPSK